MMSNFNIYRASAGSGKTYTLVREYIKKCISNQSKFSHKSLLAITFTNKAAAEMKSRIIATLFSFSVGEKIDFYEDLKKELSYSDLEIQQKSKKSLSDIIHYYSSFSVSTIDKFIHGIIRNFSYELDLPANFEVEMDAKKIIQDAVFSLLDDVGMDKTLTNNLIDFSEHKTNQEKYWDIENDLLDLGKELFKDNVFLMLKNIPSLEQIKKDKKDVIIKIINFEKSVQRYYSRIKKKIQNIPSHVFIYKALPVYLNKIKNRKYKDILIQSGSRLYNCIHNHIWYSKGIPQLDKAKIDSIAHDLEEIFYDYISFLEKKHPSYLFYKQYYNSLFLMSVLSKINKKIQINKKENNLVHISEFNQIIHYFLTNTSAPFIYEKIGNKYLHHFIDEFQDTSIIQWQNLLPLIENSLSAGGSCLLVGDGKQSIYRWRGGEVEQFLSLCNKDKVLSQFNPHIHSLDINRRSAQTIVDFNNEFFSFLSKYLLGKYTHLYSHLAQKKHLDQEGYVQLDIVDSIDNSQIINKTLDKTHNTILSIVKDNYNFSDIFILTRTNQEITSIATYLSKKGVPVISSEALLLSSSDIIHFLLNVLRILLNESDALSRARVIEYLILNNIVEIEELSFSEILYNYSRCSNTDFQFFLHSKKISFNKEKYINLHLYELIENIIRDFKLQVKNNLFITFFLDFVLDFSVKKGNSIRCFLQEWELKKDTLSIVIPSGINAVEIMTIHKSKGLEFPIVIFPFANWKEDLGLENQWFSLPSTLENNNSQSTITLLPVKKELEKWPPPFPSYYGSHKQKIILDNINLLYVALTRAKTRLYIYTNLDPRKGNTYKYFTSFLEYKKNSNSLRFTLGNKSKKQIIQNNSSKEISNHFISYKWRDRLKIKQNYSYNKDIKIKYAINWGQLIHSIMSEIKTKDDVQDILNKYFKNKLIDIENLNRIKREILSILSDSQITHLFDPGLQLYSEYSILSKNGLYRPDRVVISSKGKVSIIDYKTGEQRNSDIIQMKNYETILSTMGYQDIDKYLVYLTQSYVKKI